MPTRASGLEVLMLTLAHLCLVVAVDARQSTPPQKIPSELFAADPRIAALEPAARGLVLKELDGAKANCETNLGMKDFFDCDCYVREVLAARLSAGTDTHVFRGQQLLKQQIRPELAPCVSTEKTEKYGADVAEQVGMPQLSGCVGRELAVRFRQQPVPNHKYVHNLLNGAISTCMNGRVIPAQPPGQPNVQTSTPATTSSTPPAATPAPGLAAATSSSAGSPVGHGDKRPAAAPSPSSSSTVVPLNSYRGFLLTVRDNPQVASHAALLRPTLVQVMAEQKMWATIQATVDSATQSPKSDHYKLNPKRKTFLYEWQTEAEASRTDLVDVFLRTDADWSFVTREPQWDSAFGAIVEAFLFARKSVEGREASFAAQELVPVYKRHLDAAVAKAPTKLFMTLPVPAAGYDFPSQSIRFPQAGTNVHQGRPSEEGIELLQTTDHPRFEGLVLPASAGSTANYHLFGAVQSMHRADPPSSNPGVDLNMSPTQSWRSYFSIGSSSAGEGENIPYVEVLALDRQLRLASIPLDRTRAEMIAKAANYATMGTITGLTAKVYFDADRVELSHRTVDGQKAKYGLLFAKLQRIDIHGPENELLTSFKPDSLPAPAARLTTTAPPPAKLPAEQTETLAERQAKINQDVTVKTNEILADLKKKSDAQLAQAAGASQAAAQPSAGAPGQSAGASAGPAWKPCGGDLKSGPSQTVVPVEFVNTSQQPRKLIWFDFAGAKIVAGTLQPGQHAPMQTYTTHAWMVADMSGTCLGTLVISKAGSIEIR